MKPATKYAPYGDRLSLTVKDLGREVKIKVNRGKAVCSLDGKLVTITYNDSPSRKSK
jgi:hypothetical protein